jgi:two-component system, chemotaxis family, sensor kinase CheA
VSTVHGQPTASVRDRTISMVSIGKLFAWGRVNTASDAAAAETMLVILEEKGRQLALAVDRVLGEEDAVIKSVSENYRNMAGVIGASIRGDGRVSLILDPPAMFQMIFRGNAASVNAATSVNMQENVP